jgi:hypothetical protein
MVMRAAGAVLMLLSCFRGSGVLVGVVMRAAGAVLMLLRFGYKSRSRQRKS